jgi:hypothetical protein
MDLSGLPEQILECFEIAVPRVISRSMALQFGPAQPSEQPALLNFLLAIFGADPILNSFRPEVLEWKYFTPHPDWNGSRSFVLKADQKIAAHASVWPIRLVTHGSELKTIHPLDWAATRTPLPGAGIQILRRIAAMADLLIAVGGSSDTRGILPKIGFKTGGEFERHVYVARPWRQLRTCGHYDWKTPLRFLRNAAPLIKGLPPIPERWQATRVSQFEPSLAQVYDEKSTALRPRSVKTAAVLNYMLQCPAAEFSGFVVSESNQLRGYFMLARVGGQARIVDLDLQNDAHRPDDWRAISLLAAHTAVQDPRTAEVIVGTSRAEIGESFKQIGFWRRRVEPIYYLDPGDRLPAGVEFDLSLIDNDFSFLYNPRHPYMSW